MAEIEIETLRMLINYALDSMRQGEMEYSEEPDPDDFRAILGLIEKYGIKTDATFALNRFMEAMKDAGK